MHFLQHSVRGWFFRHQYISSFILGCLSVLALSPFAFWPILFFTLGGLVVLLDNALGLNKSSVPHFTVASFFKNKTVFLRAGYIGWFFGFGYLLAGLHWMGFAFLVEAEKFAILIPLCVLALPAFLALFYFAATFLAAFLWSTNACRIVALSVTFALCEYARGKVLTGLPWNSIGYGMLSNESFLQLASVFGLYGVNFLTILFFATPVVFFTAKSRSYFDRYFAYLIAILMLSSLAYGYFRLQSNSIEFVENMQLRLVQPNIPQKKKTQKEAYDWIFSRLIENSKANLNGKITHIIWPEVAVPVLLARDIDKRRQITRILGPNAYLLTGSYRLELGEKPDKYKVFNSLIAFDHKADVSKFYDKVHLVPFGEYLPMQKTLEDLGFEQITRIRGGFEPGKGKRYFSIKGLPSFSPLICYEVIFPGQVTEPNMRPNWLLNITNDAWFGYSLGPYQHFQQARVRAVEEGLPLVRVANTGISGVIDPVGNVLSLLNLGKEGYIDEKLPKSISETVYSKYREVSLFSVMFISIIFVVFIRFFRVDMV